MRTDDQYFSIGDKVVRVAGNEAYPSGGKNFYPGEDQPPVPQYGQVYCVEDFWVGPQFNAVIFVGGGGWRYGNGMKVGWPAKGFRRVEEIKLCVRAAEKMRNPVTREASKPA